MAALYIHTSNKLEILAKELAILIRDKDSKPFDPTIIMIQSKGMERWLSMQIAKYNGICANVSFPFPNALIYKLFKLVLEDLPEDAFLDVEVMKWKLMKILPLCINQEQFFILKNYAKGLKKDLRLFQLSYLIADTFDQYIIFRPEMIFKWEKGGENHWQAELFRILITNSNGLHRARLANLFVKRLPDKKNMLPDTIYVFGISSIPKFHMNILVAISKYVDVHLFLMNPCKEYWGDILSEKEIRKKGGLIKEELYMEKGNPLLSSLGRMGRDFFDIINEYQFIEDSKFEEIKEKSLLSCIQSDILYLRNPEEIAKRKIDVRDCSVQVHSCHSPMREVEVLYDSILDMLENDPHLKPRDIIVMTPDINKYAPFIQAVFGHPDPDIKIPFSIADRSPRWESKTINAFFKILDLRESRFEASKVLDILESNTISNMFGISVNELKTIRKWIKEAGIRWGIDKNNREEISNLSIDIGTWKYGIRRIALGYALVDEQTGIFKDVFPYDGIEGGEAEIFGRFSEFLERLFAYVKGFSSKRSISEWREFIFNLLQDLFFIDEENQKDVQLLRNIINEMVKISEVAGFNEKLDLDVFVWNMQKLMDRRGYGSRFITGGITFCAMLPMRSIPFKVICLIGMNYDSFPRHHKKWEFDIIQKHPQKGDRSKRDEDRYIFLEAILSAREKLYISYTGQSIKDNTPIPPSVVVSELLDYIEEGFFTESRSIIEHIFFIHPLHPFSPIYFDKGSSFFSYSKKNMLAAQAMLNKRIIPASVISKEISSIDKKWKNIDILDLCNFFSNPCKFFLKNRLFINLDKDEDVIKDIEPLRLKDLEKYQFEQELLNNKLSGNRREKFMFFLQAKGLLPLGNLGEYEFKRAEAKANRFIAELSKYKEKDEKALNIELQIDDFHITANIKNLYLNRMLFFRFARIRPIDRLKMWLHYLTAQVSGIPLKEAMFIGLNDDNKKISILRLLPLEQAEAKNILKHLLYIYWDGLSRPIHFFPESSWTYFESIYIRKEDPDKAFQKAKHKWEGNEYSRGESKDEYYEFCFRDVSPLDNEFLELSKAIFLPIIIHSKKEI